MVFIADNMPLDVSIRRRSFDRRNRRDEQRRLQPTVSIRRRSFDRRNPPVMSAIRRNPGRIRQCFNPPPVFRPAESGIRKQLPRRFMFQSAAGLLTGGIQIATRMVSRCFNPPPVFRPAESTACPETIRSFNPPPVFRPAESAAPSITAQTGFNPPPVFRPAESMAVYFAVPSATVSIRRRSFDRRNRVVTIAKPGNQCFNPPPVFRPAESSAAQFSRVDAGCFNPPPVFRPAESRSDSLCRIESGVFQSAAGLSTGGISADRRSSSQRQRWFQSAAGLSTGGIATPLRATICTMFQSAAGLSTGGIRARITAKLLDGCFNPPPVFRPAESAFEHIKRPRRICFNPPPVFRPAES